MHRSIELFGAPGSGKTSLYRVVFAGEPPLPHLRSWEAFSREQPANSREASFAALHKDTELRSFVGLCLAFQPRGKDNPLTRLRRLKRFAEDVERIAAVKLAAPGAFVLFDECLAQRGVGLALSSHGNRRMMSAYYSAMPLPMALAVLDPPIGTLARQLEGRAGSFDARARRLAKIAQDATATGVAILRARGVHILELKGSDMSENAEKVRDLAHTLFERGVLAGPVDATERASPSRRRNWREHIGLGRLRWGR